MTQANLADQVFDAVKGWLQRNVSPLMERIKALEDRAPIAGPQGEKGDPGRDGVDGKDGLPGERGEKGDPGRDGKDADPDVIKSAVETAVAAIPRPADGLPGADGKDGRDGVDGKDADPLLIKAAVDEAVAAIPRPADGAPGKDGRDGIDGRDGKDINPDVVKATIEAIVATIPRPADGINGKDGRDGVDGKDGAPGERGMDGIGIKGDPGMDGRDGLDGEPGRDAVQIEVLGAIDPGKRYQRGTFATWEGGIIRSFRATDPLKEGDLLEKAGWHVVVRGISFMQVEGSEDKRTVTVRTAFTGSPVVETELHFPVTIYRGIYQADTAYEEGDAVTWDGSIWNALKSTQEKPGASDAWRLSVKRGRDGRDGVRGEKGERGAEGRAGKDLTQKGPDGSKW